MTSPRYSRQTYQMVADVLREEYVGNPTGPIRRTATRFADVFEADNPDKRDKDGKVIRCGFKRSIFLTAITGDDREI